MFTPFERPRNLPNTFRWEGTPITRKQKVINAEKVKLTGKKATDKIYYTHSMYPGGLKQISAGELRSKNAVRLIEKSVKGMLPHNTLGRAQGMKLKVFVGGEHTHAAQQPEVLDISGLI